VSVNLIQRDGCEVRVEDGVGRVVEVKHQAGKRNAQVIIEAQGLREPVTGWADGTDAALVEQVRAAHASLQLTPYRIEVVRDEKAPRDVAIADLPKRSKFRRLVALGAAADPWAQGAQQPPADPAVSSPAPAPAEPAPADSAAATDDPGGSPEDRAQVLDHLLRLYAADKVGGKEAREVKASRDMAVDLGATPEDLEAAVAAEINRRELLRGALRQLRDFAVDRADREGQVWVQQVRVCRELGATDDQLRWAQQLPARDRAADPGAQKLDAVRDPDRTGVRSGAPYDGTVDAAARPSPAAHSGLGHRAAPRGLADPAPYKRTYEDGPLAGQLNPSSFEVGEVVGLVKLAQRLLIRRARALAGEEGTVVAPTVEQVQRLARALMLAADRVQVAVRGETSGVDRMAGLYRRATSAVWEAIDWYPYPGPDADDGALAGWHAAVVDHATTTIRVAFALLGAPLPDPPAPEATPVAPAPQEPVADLEPAGAPA
jgi:hypothetical protein